MNKIDPKLLELFERAVVSLEQNDNVSKMITITAIIIPAIISLLIIYLQNKNNLTVKKIDVMTKSKDELRVVRNFIINYNIPTSPGQVLTDDQYNSKHLDAAITRIRQVLNVSEHFNHKLISEIELSYKEVMNLMGEAKRGKINDLVNFDKRAKKAIEEMQRLEPQMLTELGSKITEYQASINELTKTKNKN